MDPLSFPLSPSSPPPLPPSSPHYIGKRIFDVMTGSDFNMNLEKVPSANANSIRVRTSDFKSIYTIPIATQTINIAVLVDWKAA